MTDKIPNLDQIPNLLGYMVIEDDNIITSQGDLSNNEEACKIAVRLAHTAAKIPVNPDINDSFKRISMVVDKEYVFMMTISQKKIFLVKRKYNSDETLA